MAESQRVMLIAVCTMHLPHQRPVVSPGQTGRVPGFG